MATAPTVTDPTLPADCPPRPEPAPTTTGPATTVPEKPTVELPAATPTELVVTDLIVGTGAAAKVGDIVSVHYVGVRSEDGTEFDNSYDRGQPFEVTLGAGGVIQGWDEGLVGIQVGGRRQLDIPAELAYGDTPRGEIIQAGDALTFVVDAVKIVPGAPATVAADAPTEVPAVVTTATELVVTDLVTGDECDVAFPGDTVYVQAILYRGDTGEMLQSTWVEPTALTLPLDVAQVIPGLVQGIVGMGVGGRREITIPAELGFGAEGNTSQGLPADAVLIAVVDLVGIKTS